MQVGKLGLEAPLRKLRNKLEYSQVTCQPGGRSSSFVVSNGTHSPNNTVQLVN